MADAQLLINNIINYETNWSEAWPDFNPYVTLGIKEHIKKYHFVTDLQLSALTSIDAGWIKRIKDFKFNNPMHNQIVSNNKNKIHTYHKVVKSLKKNISKNQINYKNQPKINSLFAKA